MDCSRPSVSRGGPLFCSSTATNSPTRFRLSPQFSLRMRRCSTSSHSPVFLVGLLALGVILTGCTGSQNSRSSAQLRIVEGLDRPPFTPDSLVDRPDSLYFRSESPHRAVQLGDQNPAPLDVEVVGGLVGEASRRALHLTTSVPTGVNFTRHRSISIRTDSMFLVRGDAWRTLQRTKDSLVARRRVPLDSTALHHMRTSDTVTVAVNNRSYALPEPVTTDLNRLIDASPDRFPPEDGSSQYRLTAPLDEPILQDRENVRRVRRNATYPRLARTQKIQGVVRVAFIIRKDGTPTRIRIAQGAHSLLNRAALDAVRRTTFKPVRVGGKRINLSVSMPITFRIESDRVPRNAP